MDERDHKAMNEGLLNNHLENFFYEGIFFSDLDSLLSYLYLTDKVVVSNLDDDWSINVTLSKLEQIIQYDVYKLSGLVDDDKISDEQTEIDELLKILSKYQSVLDQINLEVPSLYYPNEEKVKITKLDLYNYLT